MSSDDYKYASAFLANPTNPRKGWNKVEEILTRLWFNLMHKQTRAAREFECKVDRALIAFRAAIYQGSSASNLAKEARAALAEVLRGC